MKKALNIIIYIFAAIGFILVAGYIAIRLGLTNTSGIVDTQHDYFKNAIQAGGAPIAAPTYAWAQTDEWNTLKAAVAKDSNEIRRAAAVADVPPRLIVSALVVEQLRLYQSDRELFKSVFAPLKILGDQSQFSWGVMGIKQDTAVQIEAHMTASSSPWYLGPSYEHLLAYTSTTTDTDSARFSRLTNSHSRYYSYLYAAIYMRQIEAQWSAAGTSIDDKPAVLATLFNIGFAHSKPNTDPKVGGAQITVGTSTYSFGGLADEFYQSNELTDIFPR